jgi:hypothetical protein
MKNHNWFIIAAVLIVSQQLMAVTRYVPSGGTPVYSTLQDAIDASSDFDEIIINNGTFSGTGWRDINYGGISITVRSANGADNCIIDCESAGRGFIFDSGEDPNSVLQGVTIKNGSAADGGGITCESSSPTIIDCIISNCSAQFNGSSYGGGINLTSSSANIINCIIENCFAFDYSGGNQYSNGGGISIRSGGTPIVKNCIISGCYTTSNGHGAGGSIYCIASSALISLCYFSYS